MSDNEPKRHVNRITLYCLLVCSFISTGAYLLWELIPHSTEFFNTHFQHTPDTLGILIERALSIPQWYYLLCAVLDIFSIVGLVLMWRLRKNGFYCYTLSKLILMLLPIMFLDRSFVGLGNMMIGIFFIIYYYFLLQALGSFRGKNQTTQEPQNSENL